MGHGGSINFTPTIGDFAAARGSHSVTVLVGPNNGGKTLALRVLKSKLGASAYYLGMNRFYSVQHLGTRNKEQDELQKLHTTFETQLSQGRVNNENNALDLGSIFTSLTDSQRGRMLELCGELLECRFELRRIREENLFSPHELLLDGDPVGWSSTGTRTLLTLIAVCMDTRFNIVLLDEPELGLNPRIQRAVADALYEPLLRSKWFAHLEHVYVATHSHLFMSRGVFLDNHVVTRHDGEVSLTSIKSHADFNKVQFDLLGNRLDSMFMPEAIVIVEGKTDRQYIRRLVDVVCPGRTVVVEHADGDGRVKDLIHVIGATLDELRKSPYHNRLFVVLDSRHSPGLKLELEEMGVKGEHIIEWSKNGIEYYYPEDALSAIYGCDAAQLSNMKILGDEVSVGEVSIRKQDLSERVTSRVAATSQWPQELVTKLMEPIKAALGAAG